MALDRKIGVLLKLMFGTVTCLSCALPVLSDSSKLTKTSCPGEFSQQSTSPRSYKCEMVRLADGTMLQTVPKLFSPPGAIAGKIPCNQTICRIPDCGKDLCKNGCCEETMVGYNCHCSSGFQGRHCDEQSRESSTTDATTKPTTSPKITMSATTTSQETITPKSRESSTTDATTKPTTSPATTMSEKTTSPETIIPKPIKSSNTDATTKPTTSPTTTMSDTTTSQETIIPNEPLDRLIYPARLDGSSLS